LIQHRHGINYFVFFVVLCYKYKVKENGFLESGQCPLFLLKKMETPAGKQQDPVLTQVSSLVDGILRSEGMELVDVLFRREPLGWILRIFIDKPGGVTIADCSAISQQASDLLDVKDIIHHPYRLEVSSPGINRPLKKETDFERFIGEYITVKTTCLIENRKTFRGKLTGYHDGSVCMEVEGKQLTIPYGMIEKANVDFPFNKPRKQ
jgi:ribosome maturation factor RimP